MTQARRALGAGGEDAVAAWYEAEGYEVVARNWRCPAGELDLIVRRARTFVFCEAKVSSTNDGVGVSSHRWVQHEAPHHGQAGEAGMVETTRAGGREPVIGRVERPTPPVLGRRDLVIKPAPIQVVAGPVRCWLLPSWDRRLTSLLSRR